MGVFVCKVCKRSSTNHTQRGRPLKKHCKDMCSSCYNKTLKLPIKKCVECGKETTDYGFGHCAICYDKYVRVRKECVECGEVKRIVYRGKCGICRTMERKIEAYSHYCNDEIKCQCCGESEIDMLSLDHINNDGAYHRRSNPSSAKNLVGYVIKNNFPEGYQVLCMNCNFSKSKPRNKGRCMHEIHA